MTTSAIAPTQPRTAVKAFYFNTSAHLLRITRQKAGTLAEFLDALRECPEGSIFQHTFRTLQEHHFIREGFSNDLRTGFCRPAMSPALPTGWPVWMCASSPQWLNC